MAVQPPMKRRRMTSPSTSSIVNEVPGDIFRSIFKRLSFDDIVRAKSVCSSWNLVGEDLVSSMPFLILPSKKQVEESDDFNNNGYKGFLNLKENRVYNLKTVPKELNESCCIGSSNGWLIFLEDKAVPFLLNPFRQVKIQLPSVDHLLGLERMERNMDGEYELDYIKDNGRFLFKSCGKQRLRDCFIQKAILTRKPDNKNENYGMVLLCNNGEEIVYHESGNKFWSVLDVNHPPYQDIICHENNLYALSENRIEVWDLKVASKKSDIVIPFPDKSSAKFKSLRDVCTTRFYLAESCGDLLLVVRFIGDYVDWDGTMLNEWDLLDEECNHPKVCPYRTCLFHVYKMDLDGLKWVEMECLGDRALFLGGNQSVSISAQCFPNCENNSIYFTDDCWEKMEEDYLYGGHDMGIFNLKDGSLKPIYEFSSDKIQPPPCWIIPPALLES